MAESPDASLNMWLAALESVLQHVARDPKFAASLRRRIAGNPVGEDTRACALMSLEGWRKPPHRSEATARPERTTAPNLQIGPEPELEPELELEREPELQGP